jgi:hypothetical protein
MSNWSVIYANTQKLDPTFCRRFFPGAGADRCRTGRNARTNVYDGSPDHAASGTSRSSGCAASRTLNA